MLAASAENPHLLDPAREVIKATLENLKATSDDLDAALVGWLAIVGLNGLEMHGLSPFSEKEHERVVQAVNRLLLRGIVALSPRRTAEQAYWRRGTQPSCCLKWHNAVYETPRQTLDRPRAETLPGTAQWPSPGRSKVSIALASLGFCPAFQRLRGLGLIGEDLDLLLAFGADQAPVGSCRTGPVQPSG
jgi:hypothetical protein